MCVLILATLNCPMQRGSVELTRDFDSGHYASKYVDIAGGTYQGQLVVGSGGFIHPVRDFTVSKDDEVVILQFTLEPGGTEGKTNQSLFFWGYRIFFHAKLFLSLLLLLLFLKVYSFKGNCFFSRLGLWHAVQPQLWNWRHKRSCRCSWWF